MKVNRPFKGKYQEFEKGEKFIKSFPKGVVIFGSARTKPSSWEYNFAFEVSRLLSSKGITVITGGGAGIMEASNKGAKDGVSVAMNITLPHEQCCNEYANKIITFEHFYIRKYFLLKSSKATIIMPGGFGTLDEGFETLTLLQTGKIAKRPVVFVGKKYYNYLNKWIKKSLYKNGSISKKDFKIYTISDDVQETFDLVKKTF
jgi:uncharacterized protein (TIGR00730 family)